MARHERRLRRGRGADAVAAVVEHEPLLPGDPVAAEPPLHLDRELLHGLARRQRRRRAEHERDRARQMPALVCVRPAARRRAPGRPRPGAPAPRPRRRAAAAQTSARNPVSAALNSSGCSKFGRWRAPAKPGKAPLRRRARRAGRPPRAEEGVVLATASSTGPRIARTSSVVAGRGSPPRRKPAGHRSSGRAPACATRPRRPRPQQQGRPLLLPECPRAAVLAQQRLRLVAGLLALGRVRVCA